MSVIVGVDEVGRGCWAGPLVAACVILDRRINGLRDSKLLTKEQRELLAQKIQTKALAWGIGWVEPAEIDQLGLTRATGLAMKRAMQYIALPYDEIIVDGAYNYLKQYPHSQAMIKADQKVPAVSAASIIAKVARDQYMSQIADRFPNYGFHRHVGYGTKLHRDMLALHGICELHRQSFAPIRLQADATMPV